MKSPKLLVDEKPDIAAEWHPTKNDLSIESIKVGSHRRVWWQCFICGNEWQTEVRSRLRAGCRSCLKKKKATDYRSTINLKVKRPDIAMEWHPSKNSVSPDRVTPFENEFAWWKCTYCGSEWRAWISARTTPGCPDCQRTGLAKLSRDKNESSFASEFPKLAEEWHPTKNSLTPDLVRPHSRKRVHWICGNGHEWVSTPNTRTTAPGCPFESGHRLCPDTSLGGVYPDLAREWHQNKNTCTPFDVTPRCNKKVWWLCPRCGREWRAAIAGRSRGAGCICYSRVVLKDGICCDSMVEALFWLRYKEEGLNFEFHGRYGAELGKREFDFYFPDTETYIEITSYRPTRKMHSHYWQNIEKKRRYVEDSLCKRFKCISYEPSRTESAFVRSQAADLPTGV